MLLLRTERLPRSELVLRTQTRRLPDEALGRRFDGREDGKLSMDAVCGFATTKARPRQGERVYTDPEIHRRRWRPFSMMLRFVMAMLFAVLIPAAAQQAPIGVPVSPLGTGPVRA